ncbi:MAG TPA: VWA domain-containing protein [Pyrinomonadaceae bacterium]|nr:VWA domain-containing protein [Pyrinomonadaceae bacterium]
MSFRRPPRPRAASLLLAATLLLAAAPATFSARTQGPQPTPNQQPPNQQPQAAPSPSPAPQEDEEVERVETDLTAVLLTAVDRQRRFVTTLRQEDVRVFEDGVEQQLTTFQRETETPLSLAVVVDASKSQERTLPDEKAAARAFFDSVLRPGKDSAAVVSFTGRPYLRQPLTKDAALLRAAVEALTVEFPEDDPRCTLRDHLTVAQDPRCWSAIWDAVWASIKDALAQTPPQSRRAVVLLSDGDDTTSLTKKDELIDFAVRSNAVIYSIGIGDRKLYDIDEGALEKVSERTGGRAFFPETRAELDAAFAQINQELRSQYLLAYTPSNRRRDGSFRRVRVELTNPALKKQKLRLLYREGYYALPEAGATR